MGKVLHASYSGWFPFCVTESDGSNVGEGTEYPIAMSLNESMYLYWKVKSWQVNITLDTTTASFPFERRGEGDPMPNPTKEEDLVCYSGIGGDFFPSGFDQIGIGFYLNSPRVIRVGELFYPNIFVSGNIAAQIFNSVYEPPAEYPANLTLDFGEVIYSLNISKNGSFSLTGSIQETDTWPYAD